MRLANEIAAGAMEHVQGRIRPGMRESEVGALWNGWVHDHGTGFEGGKVELAHGFSLVWSGPGIRTFTATGSREIQEHEPTLFEIWVVRRRLLVRLHEDTLSPGSSTRGTPSSSRGCWKVYELQAIWLRRGASLAELDRLVREGRAGIGYPGQPSHPICHGVGARAHQPPHAHQAAGGTIEAAWCGIKPWVYWPEGGGLRVEDNFLITETGSKRLAVSPTAISRERDDPPRSDLDGPPEPARARAAVPRHCRPLRHDVARRRADRRRRLSAGRQARHPGGRSTTPASIGRGGLSRASRPRTRRRYPADRRGRVAGRDLGLRAGRAGGCRAASRARRPRAAVIHRARSRTRSWRPSGVSHEDMLARIRKAVGFAAGEGITVAFFGVDGSRAVARLLPPRRRGRGRGRRQGGRRGATRSGSPLPRARRTSSARPSPQRLHGARSTGTATTTSGSKLLPPWPRCRPAASWVQGTVNGMGDGPATRISSRSR